MLVGTGTPALIFLNKKQIRKISAGRASPRAQRVLQGLTGQDKNDFLFINLLILLILSNKLFSLLGCGHRPALVLLRGTAPRPCAGNQHRGPPEWLPSKSGNSGAGLPIYLMLFFQFIACLSIGSLLIACRFFQIFFNVVILQGNHSWEAAIGLGTVPATLKPCHGFGQGCLFICHEKRVTNEKKLSCLPWRSSRLCVRKNGLRAKPVLVTPRA